MNQCSKEYKTEMMKMCFQESKFLYDQGRYDLVFPGALMVSDLADLLRKFFKRPLFYLLKANN